MWKIVFIFIFVPTCLFSQQKSFLSLRYNEDYSYLKADTARNLYSKLKYYSLDSLHRFTNSIGAEIKTQVLNFTDEDWQDNGNHTEFYQRYLLHTDFRYKDKIRLFVQLSSTHANGRIGSNRSVDENKLAFSQLFVDYNIKINKSLLQIRVGRQEMPFGIQRLYSVREGLNNRLSFDAAKVFIKTKPYQINFFYGNTVLLNPDFFDDKTNYDQKIWGNYWSFNTIPIFQNLDIYYLGNYYRTKLYNSGSDDEMRHTIGLRITDKEEPLYYDFEAVYQFGKFGIKNINAYTASIDAGYWLKQHKLHPKIGFKTEIISGDKNNNDNELNTFNPLFPRGAYFGLAALIGPANLVDCHPYLSFEIGKQLELSIDYDFFWRYSTTDALYNSPMVIIASSKSDSKHIGNQLGFSIDYKPNKFMKLSPEFTWFHTGEYLNQVTQGKDILFAGATLQIKL